MTACVIKMELNNCRSSDDQMFEYMGVKTYRFSSTINHI